MNQRRAALGLEPAQKLEEVPDTEVPDVILETAADLVADMSKLSPAAMAQNQRP